MANSLSTIGSIAIHIVETISALPAGVSGNMVEIVDLARQHVSNFTGDSIGSNSIADKYQPPIVDFSKADAIDLANAGPGGDNLKLSDLSIGAQEEAMTADQYRKMGEIKLRGLGRGVLFTRSVS